MRRTTVTVPETPVAGPILIVEDDAKVASLVALYLKREGYETIHAGDGHQALTLAATYPPSFVVLDLMLPGLDGWEVCRALRAASAVPILMLTARDSESDRIGGLSLGADDYLVKPFSPRELVARVKAILRRTGGETRIGPEATRLVCGPLVFDLSTRQVLRSGQPITLTPHERKLLAAMMRTPGRIFTRAELLDRLYPAGEAVVEKVVDVHISKLRQKIEDEPAHPRLIITDRGLGYHFSEDAAR
jgi:DNA-binding response OmpR family regulator